MRLSFRSAVRASAALLVFTAFAACKSSGDGRAAAGSTSAGSTSAGSPSAPAAPGNTPATAATATGGGETVTVDRMPADSIALRAAADAGRILGAPTAKVWMIEASDFQCPFCKMWHDQSYEALKREYVDAGKVRLAFFNFPLEMHVQAQPAAEAAMCASAQGKFWEYHSALFRDQATWGTPGDQSAYFDAAAARLGLDAARFRGCTRSRVMRALVEADRDRMAQRGVGSTPSFFVGNQRVDGAEPVQLFRQLLDAAVAQAK